MRCAAEVLCHDWLAGLITRPKMLTRLGLLLAIWSAVAVAQAAEMSSAPEVPAADCGPTSACACNACPSIAGVWEGCWEAHCSGHSGKLRAVIRPCGTGQFFARFHAVWWRVFHGWYRQGFHYHVDVDGVVRFSGQRRMSRLVGGTYYYNGYIRGDEFCCHWCCSKDRGVFYLRRVGCGRGACGTCACGDVVDACVADGCLAGESVLAPLAPAVSSFSSFPATSPAQQSAELQAGSAIQGPALRSSVPELPLANWFVMPPAGGVLGTSSGASAASPVRLSDAILPVGTGSVLRPTE